MAAAAEGDAEAQEIGRSVSSSSSSSGNWEVPVYFALISPRAGAHAELLSLLQTKIVAPLIDRRILCEFRVLTTTPPSFLMSAATLVVFELTVPCPWPITDWDVRQWQRRLGSGVHLVVAPSNVPRRAGSWDAGRARSALARAMVLPPTKKGPPPRKQGGWIASCMDRSVGAISASAGVQPTLSVIEESSGNRVRLAPGATLMNPAMAAELCQFLPVSLRFRTAWRLAYSPRQHGVSLKTFYRLLESEGPSLLLVQDHGGCAFGGFATAAWHAADRYFGSGECFVFRFRRRFPKPLVPLQTEPQASKQLGDTQGHSPGTPSSKSQGEEVEGAAVEMIQRAVKVLSAWHPKVRAEAERAEREATAAGRVTSLTEALDEVLGRYDEDSTACGQPAPASSGAETPLAASDHGAAPIRTEETSLAEETAEEALCEDCNGQDEAQGQGHCQGDGEDEDEDAALGLETFHWALKDPFFLFSDLECIAMGGGSSFALYLEKDLLHGMSEPCTTFSSPTLSSAGNFIISNLECWVFDDPSEVDSAQ